MRIKAIITVVLCFSLYACGFKPRQDVELPALLQSMHIKSNTPYSDWTKILQSTLQSHQVIVNDQDAAAHYTLEMLDDHFTKKILSASATNRVRQQSLKFQAIYQLINAQGKIVWGPKEVNVQRFEIVDINQIQSDKVAQHSLQNILHQEAAKLLIYQLATFKDRVEQHEVTR